MKINNEVITKIDNNYYMIFEWLDGRTLKANEITEKHCEIIGEVLAKIHNIDFNEIEEALNNNEFVVYYQPKYSIREKRFISSEAFLILPSISIR